MLSHTDGGITLYLLKNAATWMDLEISILSAVSPTERQMLNDITCMWDPFYKKIQMNLIAKQKRTSDIEDKRMISRGERGEEG